MAINVEIVHNFFNKTDNYLSSSSTITLRKLIVSEMINNVQDSEIIDVGCGNGMVSLNLLEHNHVTFLDLSKNMLEKAKETIPLNLLQRANFSNSTIEEFQSQVYFDIVLLLGVLAHVRDIDYVISKISSISKTNSLCIVQITNNANIIAKFLRSYSRIRKLLFKSVYEYNSNLTDKTMIEQLFLKYGYSLIDQRKYLPTFPGFRFLKQETRTKFLLKSYKSKLISSIGSEIILKFIKTTHHQV